MLQYFIALQGYKAIDFLSGLINWCLSVWYMLLQFVCLYEEKKLIFCSAVTFYCTPEPLTPLSSDVSLSGIYCCLFVPMVCYSRYFIIYVAFVLCYLSCVFWRLQMEFPLTGQEKVLIKSNSDKFNLSQQNVPLSGFLLMKEQKYAQLSIIFFVFVVHVSIECISMLLPFCLSR